ncbi:hypothetical protein [Alkaliphilus sp. B6464]|uniref:hypothetical protein n=1 Tax=Alkaliphilus sp. B6464 TaxID=2731219 RepID=UPI001BA98921|nr:hypothetical protein [Alkaliphilus sp. B6464]QUH22185.1 hypothetical protein HYG84_19965 [Alkaliphilus sp. B6464]
MNNKPQFILETDANEKGETIFTLDDLVRNQSLFNDEEYLEIALKLAESHIIEHHNLGHSILVVDKTEGYLVLAHF